MIKLSYEEILDEGMDWIHVTCNIDWWQVSLNL